MPLDGASDTRKVAIGPLGLGGFLALPKDPAGIVIFAHGSGSGRFSPRNNFVAQGLNERGLATLLLDLLTEGEVEDRSNVLIVRVSSRSAF